MGARMFGHRKSLFWQGELLSPRLKAETPTGKAFTSELPTAKRFPKGHKPCVTQGMRIYLPTCVVAHCVQHLETEKHFNTLPPYIPGAHSVARLL